jgi:hypothetical protein
MVISSLISKIAAQSFVRHAIPLEKCGIISPRHSFRTIATTTLKLDFFNKAC